MYEIKSSGKFDAFNADELQGGTAVPFDLVNFKVAAGTEIKRGMLLASSAASEEFTPAEAGDENKMLVIARENFKATATSNITTGYTSGIFNREKIIAGEGVLEAVENGLRRQDIRLTSLKGAE